MTTSQAPLKIGILLRNRHDGPGGLEKVLEIVAKAMPQKNVELRFYGLYAPNYDLFTKDFKNVTYLALPKTLQRLKKILSPKIFRVLNKAYVKLNGHKLFDQMQADNLDALITMDLSKQFLGNYQFLKDYKEKSGVRLLSWVHSSLSGNSDQVKIAVKEKIGLFDGHLAISTGIERELRDNYNALNISIIYNPVVRAEIIKRDLRKFIYIGRIDANKRIDSLLIQLQKLIGDWTLDIFGSTGQKKADTELAHKIIDMGLGDKVFFHGWKADVWKEIKSAGIILLNSKKEGLPLVLVEAMMRGVSVVSSNCPTGPSDIIQHGQNGWLYSVDDESQIHKILQHILDGELQLLAPEKIRRSILAFEVDTYMNNFISKLMSDNSKLK